MFTFTLEVMEPSLWVLGGLDWAGASIVEQVSSGSSGGLVSPLGAS